MKVKSEKLKKYRLMSILLICLHQIPHSFHYKVGELNLCELLKGFKYSATCDLWW